MADDEEAVMLKLRVQV